LMLKVLKNADFIMANSQFTKKELLNLNLTEEKIIVVYPCCHVSPAPGGRSEQSSAVAGQSEGYHVSAVQVEKMRDRLNLKDKKILLTVGRLVERKGQDMIIKLMPRLLKEIPNLVYLIIGDGPEKSNFQFLISNCKLHGKIMILDNVSDEELPIYYQLANLFVMPARDIQGDVEGFGIVYLEANSFGLPVVAGESGGIHEAVIDGQTGLLVDPVDEDDIYQKIIKLLSNPELYQKLSENGRIRVEKEFNWEKQSEKILFKIENL